MKGEVILGLIDGKTLKVFIDAFSPYGLNLTYKEKQQGKSAQIDTRKIAFIGFLKVDNKAVSVSVPSIKDPVEVRVHVAGGTSFLVTAPSTSMQKSVGFTGYPLEPESQFSRIFFYSHGVNLKEDTARLGDILVKEGFLQEADLHRGIEQLSDDRQTPIGEILLEQKKLNPADLEKAADIQKRRKLRIGEVLIQEGLISEQDLNKALDEQKKRKGRRIGEILLDLGIIKEDILFQTLAKKFHMPYVNLEEVTINPKAVKEIESSILQKYKVIPLDTNRNTLIVAISDPLAMDVYDVLRFHVAKDVMEVVAKPSQIEKLLKKHVQSREEALTEQLNEDIALELELQPDESDREEAAASESDSMIIRLANKIIFDAYERGASDIHIEPYGRNRNMIIRMRIDGECELYQEIPGRFWRPLVTRFKIMANLDIAERRKPQDGKIRLQYKEKMIEIRLATIPTVNSIEDVVLRILATSNPLPLDQMGMSDWTLKEFQKIITKPYGLFLCVGPTGSGKTTTLHSALLYINKMNVKIWTAEDPVEITQDRLRQVQINPKIGYHFANALRAFLRADPDVIMIGEMRDFETASIAIEASLTGHLVASTLHTNSASETVNRLLNMGLDSFTFADALLGILAQRLTGRLCERCSEKYRPGEGEMKEIISLYGEEKLFQKYHSEDLKNWELRRAMGCKACNQTGYKGRLAIHELLVADEEIRAAIERKATVSELRSIAIKNGMSTLVQDGVEKVLAGLTDLGQVLAVCNR